MPTNSNNYSFAASNSNIVDVAAPATMMTATITTASPTISNNDESAITVVATPARSKVDSDAGPRESMGSGIVSFDNIGSTSRGTVSQHNGITCTSEPPVHCNDHAVFRGADLRGEDEVIEHHVLNNDKKQTRLKTITKGDRWMFEIGTTNNLIATKAKHRCTLSVSGRCTYIQSTCMVNLHQVCNGVVTVIKTEKDGHWKLAVISGLFNMRNDGRDLLEFFEWTGTVTYPGIPDCFFCKSWEEMKSHFVKKEVFVSTIKEAFFVNQVRGKTPIDAIICPHTQNDVDKGLQCSPLGPDIWSFVPKPKFNKALGITFEDCRLQECDTGHSNLFVTNKAWDKPKKRKKAFNVIPQNEQDYIRKFHNQPKKIPSKNQQGLIVVIHDTEGNCITPAISAATPIALEKKLNFSSLLSANDSSIFQRFYCLSESCFDSLCEEYKDGLDVGDNYHQAVDTVLSEYSTATHDLFSTDKLEFENADLCYDGFIRLFAGEGSPQVDETFKTCRDVNGFVIHYKYAASRDYSEYTPLSIGFFDATFHGYRILPWFIEKINKCLGRRGIYSVRESNVVKGSNSYIGVRKTDSQRLPSVSEGPPRITKGPSKPKQIGFIYYRQQIKTLHWPFVLSLMNLLAGVTSMAAYYFYHHLATLYQFANDTGATIRFCTIAIVTIDFCCSCHHDRHDLQDWCLQDMIDKLEYIIERFQKLKDNGVQIHRGRLSQAIQTLKHVKWWGVSNPTTCCYQYITKCNKIEVYQFFLCPGLGTAYRIKNYWVHIMLASVFAHCTSAPIYIVDNKAYFGKCPKATMFAWGGG